MRSLSSSFVKNTPFSSLNILSLKNYSNRDKKAHAEVTLSCNDVRVDDINHIRSGDLGELQIYILYSYKSCKLQDNNLPFKMLTCCTTVCACIELIICEM